MSEIELPPLPWVRQALRATTETLMRELVAPSDDAPAWSDDEWRVAQAVATIHGISPLLSERLRWTGPGYWRDFLRAQRDHTERRHARIAMLLERIDAAAKQHVLPIVALKGAALHALGIYRPGERPMSDLDVLVHPDDLPAAAHLLASLGYERSFQTWKHVVFEPKGEHARASIGEHADNPIKVELHTSVAERLPASTQDLSHLVLPERDRPGLQGYRTISALMAHLLIHASGAIVFHGLRALHLEDIARTAARMSEHDWREILEPRASDRPWWVFPPLALVERHYAGRIPPFVLDAARRSCPWLLRLHCARTDVADVSLSNPRIHAFPGIEWSRTPFEAMRHVRARLLPDADTLELRREYGKYQALGADAPWVRQTQFQRSLRWLLGQRARVDTMACVRGAWELRHELDANLEQRRIAVPPQPALLQAAKRWSESVWREAQAKGPVEISARELDAALEIWRRPVFVCGVHRSGTTLMRDLLDGHPALAVLPSEGTFFTSFEPNLRRLPPEQWLPMMAQEWLRRLANPNNQRPYWTLGPPGGEACPYTKFARALIAWWPIAQTRFDPQVSSWPIVAVALAYAQVTDRLADPRLQHWVEKTPTNERFVARLTREFPCAKIIQLVRHPADVYASRKAAEHERHGSFRSEWQVLTDLERSFRIAANDPRGAAEKQMIVVRYEDLVANVATCMDRVAQFLRIAPLPVLQRPSVAGLPSTSNSSFAIDREPGQVHPGRESRASMLTRAELDRIAAVIGAGAAPFGYELASVGPVRAAFLRCTGAVDRLLARAFTRASMGRIGTKLVARAARIRA